MRYLLFSFCMLLATGFSEARELTLKQALKLAEHHSHVLKKARATSREAGELLGAARAGRKPSLSVNGLASYIDDVPTLDIELPSGGTFSRDVGTNENYQIDARLALPLYTGGRISAGVDAAGAALDRYYALERGDLDRVHYQVRLEYLGLLRADRLVEAADASLKRTEIVGADVGAMFRAGAADSVDLLEARLALTRATFERDRALSGRRSIEIRLLTLLGLDASGHLTLAAKLRPPTLPNTVSTIPKSKPELQAADAAIRLRQSGVRFAAADYLPTVSAYTGYSYGKPNLDRFNNTWNDYLTVGARLTWSFNVGGREHSERLAAHYSLRAAIHERERVQEQLSRDARLARERLKLTYEKYQSARAEFQSTSDNYRLAMEKHREGSLSANRLLEIETTLSAAQSGLAAALVDFYTAESAWLYAIGSDGLTEEM